MCFQESKLLPGISMGLRLNLALFLSASSSSVRGSRRLKKIMSSLQLLGHPVSVAPWIPVLPCACVSQGWANCWTAQLVWPPRRVLVVLYEVKTQLHVLLVQSSASIWSWVLARLIHETVISSLLFSLFTVEIVLTDPQPSLSVIYIVATWTWKPWRNTAEWGSDKAPTDTHENGAASIKRFLRTPLEEHILHWKPLLFLFLLSLLAHLLIPIILFTSSFSSILKFWYQVLVLGRQPLTSSQGWHVLGKYKLMKQHGNVEIWS